MTNIDFKIAMKTFADLWPRAADSLNKEQLNVYRMAFGNHTAEQVQSVLRDFAATSEKWPAAPAIRARLLGRKKPTGARSGGSRWDHLRATWADAGDWSDDQCELAYLKATFEGAARCYGPSSLATIYAWQQWQWSLLRQGLRTEPLAGPHHTSEARAEYERLGGLADATTVNETGRGVRANQEW